MTIKNEDIRLALQTSLLGEIYHNIRAIVFYYNPTEKKFLLRYYMDQEPSEEDFENADIVLTEFMSHFAFSEFDVVESECVYTTLPISAIDVMDGLVFCRKEN
jgi:hypothetical protein